MLDTPSTVTVRVTFCSLRELESRKFIKKWVPELRDEIAALIHNGEIHVMSSVCPHFGGEFDFDCKKGKLVCQWHGFIFDGKTKACEYPSIKLKLRPYRFEKSGDDLEVLYP